jgi:hypothetical protein
VTRALPIGLKVLGEEIRHEKQPDDHNNDKELDQDDNPYASPPNRKILKSINIEPPGFVYDRSFRFHRYQWFLRVNV